MDKFKKLIVILLFTLLVSLLTISVLKKPKVARSLTTHPVISEVQIAGTGTDDDFIELYNPTDSNFDLNGHRLVKRSAAGTSDTSIKAWDSETIIPPHGYYLWANNGWTPAVTPDTTTAATLAANNGVALRQGAEDTGTVIDSVALGSATNVFVETSPFPTNPTAGQSIERKPGESDSTGGNGEDTDNNANDFEIRTTSEPQNTSSLEAPTVTPTAAPTAEPTAEPTAVPTEEPTPIPTAEPTAVPTEEPTPIPTAEPTAIPTQEPTPIPTQEPTSIPTEVPTPTVTGEPTAVPTTEPTPTLTPTPSPQPTPQGMVIGRLGFGTNRTTCRLSFRLAGFGFLRFFLPRISCS